MILGSVPIRQRNHRFIDRSIERWVDIHFGDTSFNGNVILGHRKPDSNGVHAMSVCGISDLKPYIKMVHASPRLDYYITANTMSGSKRRNESLFGLQNIVIDVDYHNDELTHAAKPLVEAFIWRSKHDLFDGGVIPTPNSIVRTGRGVQLWWAIKPVYAGRDISRYHYDKIKNNFLDHIEALLGEYEDELNGLGVDRGASSNPVGYFRLPYTYNTKANCYGELEILHTERYDQRELTLLEAPTSRVERPRPKGATRHIPMLETDREVLRGYQTTGVRRVLQLINLRNLRNNDVGSEMRDYFNFSVYNALRMSYEHKEAMERLYAFNDGFKKPMSERELANCISSAKSKEGYKYSNTRLIELLEITPEEQIAIGLLPFRRGQAPKPNASRDAVRKALKDDRDNKILELIEKGVSQAEVARQLGIGKNTVGRVLKRLRDEMPVIEEEVTTDERESRHQNGSIYVTYANAVGAESYTKPVPRHSAPILAEPVGWAVDTS